MEWSHKHHQEQVLTDAVKATPSGKCCGCARSSSALFQVELHSVSRTTSSSKHELSRSAFYRSFWSSGEKRSYHLKKRKEEAGGKGQKGLVFVVAEEFTRDRVGKVCSPNCSQWQSRLGHIYATVIKWKRQSRRCPVSQSCRSHRHQESASIDRGPAQRPLSSQETSVQLSGRDTQGKW